MDIPRKFFMGRSDDNHPMIEYVGPEGSYYRTEWVAKYIPADLLAEAIRLVKSNYQSPYRENGVNDFYPRIRSMVKKIYSGQLSWLQWLADHPDLVEENEDLFLRAVNELKGKKKVSFPSLEHHPWIEEKVSEEILEILRAA